MECMNDMVLYDWAKVILISVGFFAALFLFAFGIWGVGSIIQELWRNRR